MTLVCKKDTAEQAEQIRAFDKKLYRVRQVSGSIVWSNTQQVRKLQAAQWRKS